MCCCPDRPNINGQPGYRWNFDGPTGIHPVQPPQLPDDYTVIIDAPGRCGGLDCHSHHFQVVREPRGDLSLCWRHGGGQGSTRLSNGAKVLAGLLQVDEDHQYWVLHAMYQALHHAATETGQRVRSQYTRAAVEKRLKVSRRGGRTRVWIEPAAADAENAERCV